MLPENQQCKKKRAKNFYKKLEKFNEYIDWQLYKPRFARGIKFFPHSLFLSFSQNRAIELKHLIQLALLFVGPRRFCFFTTSSDATIHKSGTKHHNSNICLQ